MMEVFFADGDWSVARGQPKDHYLGSWSGIAHACGWFKKKHFTAPNQVRAQAHPICANCHDEIPGALVGLWRMHNWDNIQAYEASMTRFKYTQYFYAGKPLFYLQPGHNANPLQPWPKTPSSPPV